MVGNALHAEGDVGKFLPQAFVQLQIVAVDGLARMDAPEQVLQMGGIAGIVEAGAVDQDVEVVFYNVGDVLQHFLVPHGVGGGGLLMRGHPVVDEVHGDTGGLALGERDEELLADAPEGVAADAVFNGIHLLHIVSQGHFHPDMLAGALHGKIDVVGQRKDGVGVELVGKLVAGNVHDAGGKIQHGGGQLRQKRLVLVVHVVEGTLDLGEGQFLGHLAEANALAQGDEFPAIAVAAERHIVIDPAYRQQCPSLLPRCTASNHEGRKKLFKAKENRHRVPVPVMPQRVTFQ